jgi:uncharacterized protein YkwD
MGVPLALAAIILGGCSHGPPPTPQRDAAIDNVMSLENFDHALLSRAIFWETNRVREAHEVRLLTPLPGLDEAADEQATYTALNLHVGHMNPIPDEHTVADRVAHAGLLASRVAENAIMMQARHPADASNRDYTYAAYAAYLLEGWMNSPDHRANILNPVFTHLGCSARLAHGISPGDQRIFATQVFLLPQPVSLNPR